MLDTPDAEELETQVSYPQLFMDQYAGNIMLLSDALLRVPSVDERGKNKDQLGKQVALLHESLAKACKLHNACVEFELLAAETKLTALGISETRVQEVMKTINSISDVRSIQQALSLIKDK